MKTRPSHFAFIMLLLLFINPIHAQELVNQAYAGPQPIPETGSFGIGFGLDYGGMGANLTLYPQRNIGLFAGGGYNFVGLGYNVGTKIRLYTGKLTQHFIPYATVMYGYTAAIAVKDLDQYNKVFYDMSFGLGFDFRPSEFRNGAWSFAILVPVNTSKVQDYMDDLKNNHNVEFKNSNLPIRLSLGYHFIF